MSRVAKAWKDAASVIVATRTNKNKTLTFTVQNQNKHVKRGDSVPQYDYRLLMLTRSSQSKFMPNAVVFPGGMLSESDSFSKWKEIYSKVLNGNDFTIDSSSFLQYKLKPNSPRPSIFDSENQTSDIPLETVFRICAIRELFEESGILLVVPKEKFNSSTIHEHHPISIDSNTLSKWRQEVNNDATKFVDMCSELGVVPNIWSVAELSNWLTPTYMSKSPSKRRFDTIFYFTCLQQQVEYREDEGEISAAEWMTPLEALIRHKQEKHWLAPPQVYELSRLLSLTSFEEVQHHHHKREAEGTVCWLPVVMVCKDGAISVLPGDDLYPTNIDWLGERAPPEIDETLEESLRKCKNVNRLEFRSQHDTIIQSNIPPAHGHLCPSKGMQILQRAYDVL